MAPGPSSGQDSAAGLTLNLSSNNPFRNRAVSPASPASPFDDPPPRPVSRNPFIDGVPPPPVRSPATMSTQSDPKSLTAEDIFDSLTLDDKNSRHAPRPRAPNGSSEAKRPEHLLSAPDRPRHRPSNSQEDTMRARKPQGEGSRPKPGDSPPRRPQRRPRRNSESSVIDLQTLTEEEKQMIEARRRERRRAEAARAAREGKSKDGGESRPEGRGESRPHEGRDRDRERERDGKERRDPTRPRDKRRPSRRMDIIDQLDATSIYGTGLFHHDGPFDALNPHRNRNGRRATPMEAFPKDSMNMSLGGSGPLNKQPDHATFMGNHDQEAFHDWTARKKGKSQEEWVGTSSKDAPIFDSTARGDMIHGDISVGLGTSTFLEGTPAARTAVAQQQQLEAANGLQRKKSLAQRMRPTFKGSSRDYGPPGRRIPGMRSPDGPQSAGAQLSSSTGEPDPFSNEFGKGEETITVRREGALSPTSPPARRGSATAAPLERRITTDALPEVPPPNTKPTGILGRMKSLKGGRRPKEQQYQPAPQPAPQPQLVVQSPKDEEGGYPGTAV